MIRRIVRYRVAVEHVESATEAIEAFVAGVASEEGTERYDAYRYVDDDATEIVHIMSFGDEASRGHHVGTDHVKAFVARLYPLCTDQPEFRDLALLATSRSPSNA